MGSKITIGNVCFLFNTNKDKVLLLKRNHQPMKGLWTGVGGKTDFTEDVYTSCIREIKEETNFDVKNAQLKGIVKTILDSMTSSWLLFIYTAIVKDTILHPCTEGELKWVSIANISDYKVIGFIKEIMPYVTEDNKIFEGIIIHNMNGDVYEKTIHTNRIIKDTA